MMRVVMARDVRVPARVRRFSIPFSIYFFARTVAASPTRAAPMHATCASPPGGRAWPPVVARRCSRPSRLQALRASDAPVAEPQEPLSWHQSLGAQQLSLA
jgi:hypothetical protein